MEPLLHNSNNKYTIYPIKHADIWECYQKHLKAIWFVNEVDLTRDINHWMDLNENSKYFIKHILAFFAASDGIVMENLAARFCNEVQVAEARQFYSMQIFIEGIHSEMYSLLIDTYISDETEKNMLFNAIEHFPAIRKKADWSKKWISSKEDFATRLTAFAIVEGVFFSGAFCSIYWLNENGKLPGLCMSNDFIARDEGMHCEFALLLYRKYIVHKLSYDKIREIMQEAVEIEQEFITEALPCSLIGMNADHMNSYIRFIADRLVQQLGYDALYGDANPFPFMDRICLQNHVNFFESRPSEYQKNITIATKELSFDAEF